MKTINEQNMIILKIPKKWFAKISIETSHIRKDFQSILAQGNETNHSRTCTIPRKPERSRPVQTYTRHLMQLK